MGARPPRTPRPLVPLLGLALLLGCDKLPGGDEPSKEQSAETKPEGKDADPAKTETKDDPTKAEGDDGKGTPPTDEAKALADAKAQKEAEAKQAAELAAAELAAKQAAAEAEAKARPVSLSEITVKTMGGMFGGTGMFEVTAKAHLNEVLANSTYVHVKSLCKKDELLVADVGYLNAHYTKPLDQYAAGEDAEIKGSLYSQGLDAALSPCQFEFRVGGLGGGISVPVGEACWNGSEVAMGKCEPALAPISMSGATLPIEVDDLRVSHSGGMGGSKGLDLAYLLLVRESQDNNVRITFKTACRTGGKTFVDLGQANLSAGPFRFEPGETVARSANLYWSTSFDLAAAPEDCDITTSLWKTKPGTFGEYEEVRLQDSCFQAGTLRDGRCDPSAPPPPAPTPLVAESISVDEVVLELSVPYGATDKFQLKIQADVTMAATVSQNDGVTAKVSCKAGKDNRVESAYLFGVEPHYLAPGETTRMTASAFGSHPLDEKPKTCLVEFFGGPRFSPSGSEGVDLGKFCLKKDKVKKGGKC